MVLRWNAIAGATSWQYQQKSGGDGYGGWITMPRSGAATTGHTVPNLNNGTAHTFQVWAVNEGGWGASSGEVTATTVPLPGNTGLSASRGNGRVTLSWTAAPPRDGITGLVPMAATSGPGRP